MIPFLVTYTTDYDADAGGSAIVYAEDENEARLKSEDFCDSEICEEVGDTEGVDFCVDVSIREFNSFEDGDIRSYPVIEFPTA